MRPLTLGDYLNDRTTPDKLTKEALDNALSLIIALNTLLEAFGQYRRFTSGVRTVESHKATYASINAKRKKEGKSLLTIPMGSKHLEQYCQAADLEDADGKLKEWLATDEAKAVYEKLGLYFEDFSATPTWTHCQQCPPKNAPHSGYEKNQYPRPHQTPPEGHLHPTFW